MNPKLNTGTLLTLFTIGFFAFGLNNASFAEENTKPEFGRLLTSIDERVRMDNLRQSKSQLGVDRQITYRGVVNRRGLDWVWLNDQVINARSDQSLILNRDKTLTIIVDDKHYRLKIGQTLIPALEQIQDPIAKMSISN